MIIVEETIATANGTEEFGQPEQIILFVVDDDVEYAQSLKASLEKAFPDNLEVKIFPTGESAIEEIKNSEKKPGIVLLDYMGSKLLNQNADEHIVDHISTMSPKTGIIMYSDSEFKERAMKTLAFGAHDYVVKDKFTHEHVLTSVKKALNPPKL